MLVKYAGLSWSPVITADNERDAVSKAFVVISEQRSGSNMQNVVDYGFTIDGVTLIHACADHKN